VVEKAASRRQMAQFSGSLTESSGCGSRMIFPSFVFFVSGRIGVLGGVLERVRTVPGRYGEGRDEDDVLAGACCRPRGSFLLATFDSNRTEPRDRR
jgi:hypothetical protein